MNKFQIILLHVGLTIATAYIVDYGPVVKATKGILLSQKKKIKYKLDIILNLKLQIFHKVRVCTIIYRFWQLH